MSRPGTGTVSRVAGQAVKAAAAAVDVARPPAGGVVVLAYHRVGGHTPSPVDLPTEVFAAQVAELSAARRIIGLDTALDLLAGPEPSIDPAALPVVLTFDDGTADWVDEVLPVLVEHGAPATFYVATEHVEDARPFPLDGRPVSWSGLVELVASGLATIGSHTHGHLLLDRVSADEAAVDIDGSRRLLSDRLGVECAHFAYPKGVLGSSLVEVEVRRRFRSAVVGNGTANRIGATDPFRIARIPVQVTDGLRWFRRKADGGLVFESRLRELANRRRYAQART